MSNIDNFYKDSNNIEEFSQRYIEYLKYTLSEIKTEEIANFTNILIKAQNQGSKIYFIGNGGSASTASHFATDLSIGTKSLDKPFKAISLTDNNGIITAIANDYSFDDVFFQQIKINFEKNDVLVAISASGNSRNLIKAIDYVNSIGGITVGISSFDGGELINHAQHSLHVPTDIDEYGPAEDSHLIINHIVSNYLLRFINTKI
mgnify:CR=1 FL=1|tara:strand:- start:234 stop:845 length:612 start_codon:yes stop_codon:yes gene_type:complete